MLVTPLLMKSCVPVLPMVLFGEAFRSQDGRDQAILGFFYYFRFHILMVNGDVVKGILGSPYIGLFEKLIVIEKGKSERFP